MKHLFAVLDSSALISFLDQDDSNHAKALQVNKIVSKSDWIGILPGEVFAETINVLGKKRGHKKAFEVAKSLLGSTGYQIVETTGEIRIHALNIFIKQKESVSYTDCLVMAFAHAYKTKTIFGFDQVFGKNGYRLPD